MATLTRGQSFGATETITNTKLHNLVDLATISAIVDADIAPNAAIQFSKLLASSISGALLTNLNLIPSGSGLIPFANIPVPFGSSYVSLVTIPNQSLMPLTLASWLDGVALRNLCSTPVDKQIRYNLLVSSLASGDVPAFNGANNFVGRNVSNLAVAGDILATSDDTEEHNTGTGYAVVKAFVIPRGGALRIKFDLKSDGDTAYGRIYRNGVAVGTEQSQGTSYATKSEDISGWTAGDTCQLYTKVATGEWYVRNFRIYENVPPTYVSA